jgi:hypothetical protein
LDEEDGDEEEHFRAPASARSSVSHRLKNISMVVFDYKYLLHIPTLQSKSKALFGHQPRS